MKEKLEKILTMLSTTIFGLAYALTYAENESLFLENVGNVTSNNPHILGGTVGVSGVKSPTNLSLDIILPNGMPLNIANIPVTQDGTYNVAEIVDPFLVPSGNIMLNISSSKGLKEENLDVDLSVSEIPEDTSEPDGSTSNGFIAKVGSVSAGTMSLSRAAINNATSYASPLALSSATSATRAASLLTVLSEESAILPSTRSGNSATDTISYDANNMLSGVNANTISRDDEGNAITYAQTATNADVNNSYLEELISTFGSKSADDWNSFNWNSSITQSALDYLLAVHKGQITTGISITAVQAKAIRQSLLSRLSYVNRSLINGCLSGYDLDFTGINLQYCDWRYRLKEITPAQLLLAARSINNVRNAYAGLQGGCFPAVTFTGSEDFTNVSLAYVYIGYWSGLTSAQIIKVAIVKGGVVGLFMSQAQYNAWLSTITANSATICYLGGWNGAGYWEDPFNQMWTQNSGDVTYGTSVQNNPNQFIMCNY